MKRLLKFKDPTLRSGGRNNGKNKPTNGTRKHYTRLDYTTLHERHSEGGTTEETLSKHCKIQRYALEDVYNQKITNQLMALKTPFTHERHSEEGTTEGTLSKHCKIQCYAL